MSHLAFSPALRRPAGPARPAVADVSSLLDAPDALLVPVKRFRKGERIAAAAGVVLVVEGAVLARVRTGHRVGSQLLGPGDLLDLGDAAVDGDPFVLEHRALARTVLTVGDVRALADRVPALLTVILRASTQCAQTLSEQHVTGQLMDLETRVSLLLPRLAERWGVMSTQGVLLPAFLTHSVMAELLSVRRPSFTTAAGRFHEDGTLTRLPDGRWLLGDGLDDAVESLVEKHGETALVAA